MTKPAAAMVVVSAVLVSICFATVALLIQRPETLRVGVLLPLTGSMTMDSDEVLNWAVGRINKAGGVDGRQVELVYRDTARGDINELADEFLADDTIDIVIGPQTSAQVQALAPKFIAEKKILISPSATAGELFRQFGKKKYFWRTCQGDEAQVKTILQVLSEKGVKKIALISQDDVYGRTFRDWIGFFSLEFGMDLTGIAQFDPGGDIRPAVAKSLEGSPEYVVVAAFPDDAVKIGRAIKGSGAGARVFFSDAAETQVVLDELGLGTELVCPMADPSNGFDEKCLHVFGFYPWDYSGGTYDALLLATCAFARQEYAARKSIDEGLADSFAKVAYGRGDVCKWNESRKAIAAILRGELPNVHGATGNLEFDREYGVDLVDSFYGYELAQDKNGTKDFYWQKTYDSRQLANRGVLEGDASVARTKGSHSHSVLSKKEVTTTLPSRTDAWAVIIATSDDWPNYRHQADALAVYTMLKKNGFSDDRIILFSIDDIPSSRQNPKTGDVHFTIGGTNLRQAAKVDYSGSDVTVENLRNVLLGRATGATPAVLGSTRGSDVFFYMADHGEPDSLPFVYGQPLREDDLVSIIEQMNAAGRFRRLFIMSEMCFAESLTNEIKTPNVISLAASAAVESSFGATYDSSIKQWLADDFTTHALDAIEENPQITIVELFRRVYGEVMGSHVRLVNYENFGDLSTPVSDFLKP